MFFGFKLLARSLASNSMDQIIQPTHFLASNRQIIYRSEYPVRVKVSLDIFRSLNSLKVPFSLFAGPKFLGPMFWLVHPIA